MTAAETRGPEAGRGDGELAATVLVPCHNRIEMLRDLLDGLLEQTAPPHDFEVILIDSMSTEPLGALVAEYAARAPFALRMVRPPGLHGPVPKRNFGARIARGRVLAFIDSDCRPEPQWLEAGLAAMSEPTVGLGCGPVVFKGHAERSFFTKQSAETHGEHPTYPTANVFYRRDLFSLMGGFDETLTVRDFLGRATECADTDLAWRTIKAGWRTAFAPDALVRHEVETLGPLLWLMEPTRLILLPKLVRLHPELRPRLFWWGVVFHWGTLPIYAGATFAIAATLIAPIALAAIPVGVFGLGARRADGLSPNAFMRGSFEAGLNLARCAVMAATLVLGSVRYGRPVL